MRHPPYHLRPNKAVDRLALIEAIKRLDRLVNLAEYTYYGLGGPYLEDFRLLYESYPQITMVSIEEDPETYKRQKFHLPYRTLRLERAKLKSFLARYESNDEKSMFWLDYTRLEYGNFEDFMILLSKVAAKSVIKVTLPAEPKDYVNEPEDFRMRFEAVMPRPSVNPPPTFLEFAFLLQEMLQVAAQKALPGDTPVMFQPVSSFCYSDGTGMFTLTGIVWPRTEEAAIKAAFNGWKLANLKWTKPKRIDVPILSTKERLHLERHLPCCGAPGRTLCQALGYLIDDDRKRSEEKLKQYAEYHKYYPYFVKAIP